LGLYDFDEARHKYRLEASTDYAKHPYRGNVPEQIFNSGLKPKFIYVVRNPLDRIESNHNWKMRNGKWQGPVDDESFITISNYFLQLEQYREYFDKSQILILDFDGLKTSPELFFKKIYEFLDLEFETLNLKRG
jgi:hypothetical protein